MLIFGVLLWNALTLLRSPREKSVYGGFKDMKSMRKKMMINLGINAGNFMTGVIVAAIDGAREFNTFPDMNGRLNNSASFLFKFIIELFLKDIFKKNHSLEIYLKMLQQHSSITDFSLTEPMLEQFVRTI